MLSPINYHQSAVERSYKGSSVSNGWFTICITLHSAWLPSNIKYDGSFISEVASSKFIFRTRMMTVFVLTVGDSLMR